MSVDALLRGQTEVMRTWRECCSSKTSSVCYGTELIWWDAAVCYSSAAVALQFVCVRLHGTATDQSRYGDPVCCVVVLTWRADLAVQPTVRHTRTLWNHSLR